VIECELVSGGERWGRGPKKDIHSSNKARVDSPAWHLVEALATLVSPDGNEPAIDGYGAKARALSASEKAMVATAARRLDEAVAKREMGVDHWVHDVSWVEALERLVSRPTVNIEGLVGGYTGPGGKTILPHRAVAKLDLRLVPDMTAAESLAALKAHLAVRQAGLAARAGVPAHQAIDVHRGPRPGALERLDPAHVVHPVSDAHFPLRDGLVEPARRRRHHRLLTRRQRAGLGGVAVDRRLVAVG